MRTLMLTLCFSLLGAGALLATPEIGEPKEIDLAGVSLGQSTIEILTLARKKRRKLIGPGRRIIDQDSQVQVSVYRVDRGRSLAGRRVVKSQTFMFLNKKLIAVELKYTSKRAYQDYLRALEKQGYEKKKDGVYVGKLVTGDYKDRQVQVKTQTVTSGGRRRRKWYVVIACCYQVLGENVTEENILEAQNKTSTKKAKAAKDALKHMF